MKYCPDCANPLRRRLVGGELRNHWVCLSCNTLHHHHPVIVVNGFVAQADRLLWVRRSIAPRKGLWAIPGGFLERGESLVEGCAREIREEAGVRVNPRELRFYMTGTLTEFDQHYFAFFTRVASDSCLPGAESLECGFFHRDECPWEKMAYPEVNRAIEQAYDDLESGRFDDASHDVWHTAIGAGGYHKWPVRST